MICPLVCSGVPAAPRARPGPRKWRIPHLTPRLGAVDSAPECPSRSCHLQGHQPGPGHHRPPGRRPQSPCWSPRVAGGPSQTNSRLPHLLIVTASPMGMLGPDVGASPASSSRTSPFTAPATLPGRPSLGMCGAPTWNPCSGLSGFSFLHSSFVRFQRNVSSLRGPPRPGLREACPPSSTDPSIQEDRPPPPRRHGHVATMTQ